MWPPFMGRNEFQLKNRDTLYDNKLYKYANGTMMPFLTMYLQDDNQPDSKSKLHKPHLSDIEVASLVDVRHHMGFKFVQALP